MTCGMGTLNGGIDRTDSMVAQISICLNEIFCAALDLFLKRFQEKNSEKTFKIKQKLKCETMDRFFFILFTPHLMMVN